MHYSVNPTYAVFAGRLMESVPGQTEPGCELQQPPSKHRQSLRHCLSCPCQRPWTGHLSQRKLELVCLLAVACWLHQAPLHIWRNTSLPLAPLSRVGCSNEGALLCGNLCHPYHTATAPLDCHKGHRRSNAGRASEDSLGKPRKTSRPLGLPSGVDGNNVYVLQFCNRAPSCHTS